MAQNGGSLCWKRMHLRRTRWTGPAAQLFHSLHGSLVKEEKKSNFFLFSHISWLIDRIVYNSVRLLCDFSFFFEKKSAACYVNRQIDGQRNVSIIRYHERRLDDFWEERIGCNAI